MTATRPILRVVGGSAAPSIDTPSPRLSPAEKLEWHRLLREMREHGPMHDDDRQLLEGLVTTRVGIAEVRESLAGSQAAAEHLAQADDLEAQLDAHRVAACAIVASRRAALREA